MILMFMGVCFRKKFSDGSDQSDQSDLSDFSDPSDFSDQSDLSENHSRLLVALLRQFREFLEIGFALFEEGAPTFLRLIEHIIEHGGISREFLNTCLSVELGI